MKRTVVWAAVVSLAIFVLVAAILIALEVRALRPDEAELRIRQELQFTSGFRSVTILKLHQEWSAATVDSWLRFGIDGFRDAEIPVSLRFVRLHGTWHPMRYFVGGKEYPSLPAIAEETMNSLQRERTAQIVGGGIEVAGEVAGRVWDAGKEILDKAGENIREFAGGR